MKIIANPIEKTDLIQFIQESDPYSALSRGQLEGLQPKIKILSLEKGKFIYLPGHSSNQIYHIYSGSVRMVNFIESGKEFTSSLYHAGETFGELSLAGEAIRGE